ncbi:MAG: AAA family ATPase [Candidatus Omnitrophica bacterium]|nr:AAA family ATPase [Candidatus Omnitrophota bacterium]
MYEEYWGFKEKPFQNTPDPRFFYKSAEHEDALMKMLYVVEEGLGGGVLTGVFGCGKTVVSQALLEKLPSDKYKIAVITNPQLEYVDLLRAIVRNLKSVKLPVKKTELSADSLLEILGNILENNDRDGRETVIVIDEAHIIRDESIFEALRLLLNFQKKDKFLLTLLLFGQPELKQRIEDNKQLEQRIAVKSHLEAFGQQDTRNYIIHRLRVVQGADTVFDENVFEIIHNRSGGIPRRINRICDLSLLIGSSKDAKSIDEETVEESLQTLKD